MKHLIVATLLTALPFSAFAAGSSSSAPKQTETTAKCADGEVWDKKTKTCVDPDKSSNLLTPDQLMDAVREYAYHGSLTTAQTLLAKMPDQKDDLVLTYWGFTHRKLGDSAQGNAFYRAAITQNPSNHLARSYMAQGFVDAGKIEFAEMQLFEIRANGGTGTWAETSLVAALETGKTYNH